MIPKPDEPPVIIERIGKHELCAHIGGAVCLLSEHDFYRYIPERVIMAGLRKGKSLKRGIAAQLREIKRGWQELHEASEPWAGLAAYEKQHKQEKRDDYPQDN